MTPFPVIELNAIFQCLDRKQAKAWAHHSDRERGPFRCAFDEMRARRRPWQWRINSTMGAKISVDPAAMNKG